MGKQNGYKLLQAAEPATYTKLEHGKNVSFCSFGVGDIHRFEYEHDAKKNVIKGIFAVLVFVGSCLYECSFMISNLLREAEVESRMEIILQWPSTCIERTLFKGLWP